jgi:DNA invertase Pin-like site-specific DNA recombinase
VAKRDRVGASLLDVARLMDTVTRHYWALVALEVDVHTAQGRVTLATFAPYERRLLAERTRAALAAKKAEGVRLGRRRAVRIDIIERVVAERQAGSSLYTIAAGLNAEGISGSAGGRWYASTIRSVLLGVARDAITTPTPD